MDFRVYFFTDFTDWLKKRSFLPASDKKSFSSKKAEIYVLLIISPRKERNFLSLTWHHHS